MAEYCWITIQKEMGDETDDCWPPAWLNVVGSIDDHHDSSIISRPDRKLIVPSSNYTNALYTTLPRSILTKRWPTSGITMSFTNEQCTWLHRCYHIHSATGDGSASVLQRPTESRDAMISFSEEQRDMALHQPWQTTQTEFNSKTLWLSSGQPQLGWCPTSCTSLVTRMPE